MIKCMHNYYGDLIGQKVHQSKAAQKMNALLTTRWSWDSYKEHKKSHHTNIHTCDIIQ